MSTAQTRRWSGEARRTQTADPTWVRALVVFGIVALDIVLWAAIIWGAATVIGWLTSVPVLLVHLAQAVAASR